MIWRSRAEWSHEEMRKEKEMENGNESKGWFDDMKQIWYVQISQLDLVWTVVCLCWVYFLHLSVCVLGRCEISLKNLFFKLANSWLERWKGGEWGGGGSLSSSSSAALRSRVPATLTSRITALSKRWQETVVKWKSVLVTFKPSTNSHAHIYSLFTQIVAVTIRAVLELHVCFSLKYFLSLLSILIQFDLSSASNLSHPLPLTSHSCLSPSCSGSNFTSRHELCLHSCISVVYQCVKL